MDTPNDYTPFDFEAVERRIAAQLAAQLAAGVISPMPKQSPTGRLTAAPEYQLMPWEKRPRINDLFLLERAAIIFRKSVHEVTAGERAAAKRDYFMSCYSDYSYISPIRGQYCPIAYTTPNTDPAPIDPAELAEIIAENNNFDILSDIGLMVGFYGYNDRLIRTYVAALTANGFYETLTSDPANERFFNALYKNKGAIRG